MTSKLRIFLIGLFAVIELLAFAITVPIVLLAIAAYGLLVWVRAAGSGIRQQHTAARTPLRADCESTATAGS